MEEDGNEMETPEDSTKEPEEKPLTNQRIPSIVLLKEGLNYINLINAVHLILIN